MAGGDKPGEATEIFILFPLGLQAKIQAEVII